jgi:hypothetical protein
VCNGAQVGIFRRGKYAAGKRVGKGNVADKVGAGAQLGHELYESWILARSTFHARHCHTTPQGTSVKKGQVLGYVEQLGTFVAVEVRAAEVRGTGQ